MIGIAMLMTAGGNAPIPQDKLLVRVVSDSPIDISAFRLYETGKVQGDTDMIFYGQKQSEDHSICLLSEGVNTTFSVDVPRLSSAVQKIAFTATCETGKTISSLGKLAIQVEHNQEVLLVGEVDLSARDEAALILGEVYRRNNAWKFRFVSQGFKGGLKPLAEHFGVDVADEAPVPPPAPVNRLSSASSSSSSSSTVSLSKISLTKENPKVSLDKRNDFGLIKVNLNWHKGAAPSENRGFFNKMFSHDDGVDLDLGCFVRLKSGQPYVIQALGNNFGHLDAAPFVYLLGDDRTGQSDSGEWLHINGQRWSEIDEVLVFAFIYKGVPNWTNTDGVVTIHVPNELPVETCLTEGSNSKTMCAIGRIKNDNGELHLERLNRYFSGHQDLDRAYGWGFKWRAGSK